MTELLFKEESYAILGACFEVYNEKGSGFLEAVYQECLEIEFELRELPFVREATLRLSYKEKPLKKTFEPDFLCYEKIVVELKAARELVDDHRAKLHNYLKASNCRLGLLVNFGSARKLEYERIIR